MQITPGTRVRDGGKGARLRAWMREREVTKAALKRATCLGSTTVDNLYAGKTDGTFASWRELARALSALTGERCTVEEIKE